MAFLDDLRIVVLQGDDLSTHRTGEDTYQHAGKDHTGQAQYRIQDYI